MSSTVSTPHSTHWKALKMCSQSFAGFMNAPVQCYMDKCASRVSSLANVNVCTEYTVELVFAPVIKPRRQLMSELLMSVLRETTATNLRFPVN